MTEKERKNVQLFLISNPQKSFEKLILVVIRFFSDAIIIVLFLNKKNVKP